MNFSLWRWTFLLCCAVVMVLALMPAPPKAVTTGWDKSNHLLAFAVLTCLGFKVYPLRFAHLLFGLLAYGALIEVLQSFTPNRSAEWFDLLADGLGILLGRLLIIIYNMFFRSGEHKSQP